MRVGDDCSICTVGAGILLVAVGALVRRREVFDRMRPGATGTSEVEVRERTEPGAVPIRRAAEPTRRVVRSDHGRPIVSGSRGSRVL